MPKSLATVVCAVRSNTERVAIASSEVAQGSPYLSTGTESQASTLKQGAAASQRLAERAADLSGAVTVFRMQAAS